jgi:hypothetical protein
MSRDDDSYETRIHAYALNRLSAQEIGDLVAQASSSAPLRAELALTCALVRARAEDPARALSTAFGWARLSRAIDADAAAPPRRGGWWPGRFPRWQAAAALIVAVAAWQFVAVPGPSEPGGVYGVASDPVSRGSFIAQVAFRPQAREQQIRQLLQAAGARIVAGPNALGLYEIAFADAQALAAGITRLRAEPAVVESIQRAAPEDASSASSSTRPRQP